MKHLCMIISIIILFTLVFALGGYADETKKVLIYDEILYLYNGFEDVDVTEDYIAERDYMTEPIMGIGFSFIDMQAGGDGFASKIKITSDSPIAEDKTMIANDYLDARYWGLNAETADSFIFEFMINIKNITGEFTACITEADIPGSSNESNGGLIARIIADGNGAYTLQNRAGEAKATLAADTIYKISIVIESGSDRYVFFINDEYAEGSESSFMGDVNKITAIRFDMHGDGSNIAFDNIMLDTGAILEKSLATASPSPEKTLAPTESTKTPAPTAMTNVTPSVDKTAGNGLSTTQIIIIAVLAVAVVAGIVILTVKRRK